MGWRLEAGWGEGQGAVRSDRPCLAVLVRPLQCRQVQRGRTEVLSTPPIAGVPLPGWHCRATGCSQVGSVVHPPGGLSASCTPHDSPRYTPSLQRVPPSPGHLGVCGSLETKPGGSQSLGFSFGFPALNLSPPGWALDPAPDLGPLPPGCFSCPFAYRTSCAMCLWPGFSLFGTLAP